ncbi:hypothetical protein V8F44DRAFT_597203 [Aspergillus fumigatus]
MQLEDHQGCAPSVDDSRGSSACAGRTTSILRPPRSGTKGLRSLILFHKADAPCLTTWAVSIWT